MATETKTETMFDLLEATFRDLLVVMEAIYVVRFDTENSLKSKKGSKGKPKQVVLLNLDCAWDRAVKSYLEIGEILGTKRANELVEELDYMNSAESWKDTTLLFC